jgi:transcriptional regulator with XRE-family HTH domain
MAEVVARNDLYAANGKLLVAKAGRRGVAIRKATARWANFNKVAVRWKGRHKIYWHWFEDLEFPKKDEEQLDPASYIAIRPDQLLDIPPLPQPPEHYVYNFGDNLRHFREERGLSQRSLAALLTEHGGHVAQTTVSYWERNEAAPNGGYIRALAQVLDIPPFLFFVNFRDCEWLRRMRIYVNKLAESLCEEAKI